MAELFKLNDNYLVELNKEWISTIKEFKRLLVRDKDRFKKQAQREFTFIYHALDFKSQYSSYVQEERIRQALINAELDEKLKWDTDKDLVEAYKKYEELRLTKSLQLLRSGFNVIDKVQVYFETVKVQDPDDAKKLLETIGKLGSTISSLKELEAQVKKELAEDSGIRGDKEKGDEEDPDEDVEDDN